MQLNLKPSHAAVKAYYAALNQFGQLHFDHEMAVRSAFQDLLSNCGRKLKLTLVPEYRIERAKSSVIVDGALFDTFHLAHGYWEAKDEKDDLDREVQRKLEKGYPKDNTIFQAPERAILYQAGARIADEDISKSDYLVKIVNQFFDYRAPFIEEWEEAVNEFSERIPELAGAVFKIIEEERKRNPAFVRSFDEFYALCQQAINPNLSPEAVERMLVQHLLTERIFRTIFHNPDFTRRNVVAQEIEKVIAALTSRSFNRDEFLSKLDRFYKAIEYSAENTTGFSEKQHFLNKVYERFFQGYSPKEADTHGIVYTPQPIVNFMVRSVEEILKKEFGRSLSDKGVHILDPFVGTGNFIVRIMQEIKTAALPYKYENELHCNEVMLLPYYIASMNIEHAYFERTGEYKPFSGICLVDTFELAEAEQSSLGFMTEENAQRVKRQKESPIFVIVGNPPYNAWQVNENDNNKNRRYAVIDGRVAETYANDSNATNTNALGDMYVKAFRWASDRIGEEGVVSFVSNNSFVDMIAFDGMRKHLACDFSTIYHIDLKGNARTSEERRRREGGNVFHDQIRVGVGITVLVKKAKAESPGKVFFCAADDYLRAEDKLTLLQNLESIVKAPVRSLAPSRDHVWLTDRLQSGFSGLIPLTNSAKGEKAVFADYSLGVQTARDDWTYNFDLAELKKNVTAFVDGYNTDVHKWAASKQTISVDDFLSKTGSVVKWTSPLKQRLTSGEVAEVSGKAFRRCLYRPFTTTNLYFDKVLTHRRGHFARIFPIPLNETENRVFCVPGLGSEKPFLVLACNRMADYHLSGAATTAQCFPFYTYSEDSTHRRENITDWALEQFRRHYEDPSISKWDIFHYVYAVLHHPEYRQRYAANLRRELPRIPFVSATTEHVGTAAPGRPAEQSSAVLDLACKAVRGRNASEVQLMKQADSRSFDSAARVASDSCRSAQDDNAEKGGSGAPLQTDLDVFRAFVAAGKRLAEIHVNYEQQSEYPLTKTEKAGEKLDWRVTKMRLSKDKSSLIYNQFLTLSGIPPLTYEYRLGNRSALEWIIDQYQVSTDKRSGIQRPQPRRPSRVHRAADRAGHYGQSRNRQDCRGASRTSARSRARPVSRRTCGQLNAKIAR